MPREKDLLRDVEILGQAASGSFTMNDEFKEACRRGQEAIIRLYRFDDHPPVKDDSKEKRGG
ncbi:MAG TPA: hypothetical protein VMW64_01015 [Dehalococcoidia bacterium]|nr:hypothetical protein [Dehalococcoidia bacterium]